MATERLVIKIDEKGALVVKRNIESVGKSAKATGGALKLLKGALGALAASAAIKSLVTLSDTFTVLQNKLKIVTTGTENLKAVTDELNAIATRTRSSFEATADSFSKFALSAKELGRSQQEILNFTELVNKAVIIGGSAASEAKGGLRQLAQGIASGALRGDELISVLENLPFVADTIAKGLNITRGELRDLGKQGKITAQVVLDAFKDQADFLNGEYAKTVITIGQATTLLQNEVLRLVGTFSDGSGVGRKFAESILFLSNHLTTLLRVAAALSSVFLIQYARTALPAAIAATKTWALALLANPAGLMIAALGTLIALFVVFSDKIRIGGGELASFADVGAVAFERLGEGLEALKMGVENATDFYVSAFSDVAQTNVDTVVSLRTVLGAVTLTLDQIVGAVTGVIGVIAFQFDGLPNLLGNSMARAFNFVLRTALDGMNGLLSIINEGLKALKLTNKDFDPLTEVFQLDVPKLDDTGQQAADIFFAAFKNTPLTDILEGVLDDAALKALEAKLLALKKGGGVGQTAGEAAPLPAEKLAADALRDKLKSLRDEAILLRLSGDERERVAEILALENALFKQNKVLKSGDRQVVEDLITQNQALARQADLLEEIVGPQRQYEESLAALEVIKPQLTVQQYNDALEMLKGTLGELTDAQMVLGGSITAVFDSGLDQLRNFTSGGKVLFRDFASAAVDGIADVIAALLRMQAIKAIGSAFGLPAFAAGGQFKVGGSGGTDSQLVAFKASPNERVSIETPAQQRAGQTMAASTPPAQQAANIKVVNVMDPNEIREAMAGEEGTQVIMNQLTRNKTTAQQVLS